MSTRKAFPLYGADFKQDPHAVYAQLREQGPVHRVEFPSGVEGWLITQYDAAVETLSDSRLGKDHVLGNDDWRALAAIMPEPQHSQLQAHLLHQDPPKHTGMRRPVTDALSPRKMLRRRQFLQEIAERLVDDLPASGTADLVSTYAARFSLEVLSDVIGLPRYLEQRFRREWCKVVQPVGPRSPQRAAYVALLEELQEYIGDVIDDKRRHPSTDLLGELVAAASRGELTDAELSSMVFQLLVAGQEPVTNMISLAVLTLLRHPAQLQRLRCGEVGIGAAVEELFRYDGSFELTTWRFFRVPTTVHGVTIPAGDSVIVALSAANRDPARFTDPDRLDLARSPNPHLGFGHGIHFCPGAALGRLEVQVAVETLLRRLPDLRLLDAPDDLPWVQAVLTRGVQRLPVAYTARATSGPERQQTPVATARAVLELLLPLRREERSHVHRPAECFAPQLTQITSFVRDGAPLLLTLPSFPCKSPNPRKVLGHLPDYGELLALRSLQRLCLDVARIYPPGAELLICSDGHVFADLIRVPDQHVTEYTAALRDMIAAERLDRLRIYTLDDVYGSAGYQAKRDLMSTEFGQSVESLRAEVKSDDRSLALYRGITRFLVEDAMGPTFEGTKSALLRDSRKRAYGVIQRSRAWSDLIDDRIDRSVRLSIHPQGCPTAKFGIRLLEIKDSWMTPWHSVAVDVGDGVVLMKRNAAEQIGRLVVVDGRPSHFVAHESNLSVTPQGPDDQSLVS